MKTLIKFLVGFTVYVALIVAGFRLCHAGPYPGAIKDHGHSASGDGGVLTNLNVLTRVTVGSTTKSTMTASGIDVSSITSNTFSAGDGSANNPSLTFKNSLDMGLYKSGSSQLSIGTNSTERMRFTSTGGVGIGNVSPVAVLHVNGSIATNTKLLTVGNQGASPDAFGDLFDFIGDGGNNSKLHCRNELQIFANATDIATSTNSLVYILSAGVKIRGSNTNDSARAGDYGEFISTTTGARSFTTSGNYQDLVSTGLTAGNWDITAQAFGIGSGTGWTVMNVGISQTSGNSAAGLVNGDNLLGTTPTSATGSASLTISHYIVQLPATTTFYLKFSPTYTGTAGSAYGRLTAVRIR